MTDWCMAGNFTCSGQELAPAPRANFFVLFAFLQILITLREVKRLSILRFTLVCDLRIMTIL